MNIFKKIKEFCSRKIDHDFQEAFKDTENSFAGTGIDSATLRTLGHIDTFSSDKADAKFTVEDIPDTIKEHLAKIGVTVKDIIWQKNGETIVIFDRTNNDYTIYNTAWFIRNINSPEDVFRELSRGISELATFSKK